MNKYERGKYSLYMFVICFFVFTILSCCMFDFIVVEYAEPAQESLQSYFINYVERMMQNALLY